MQQEHKQGKPQGDEISMLHPNLCTTSPEGSHVHMEYFTITSAAQVQQLGLNHMHLYTQLPELKTCESQKWQTLLLLNPEKSR